MSAQYPHSWRNESMAAGQPQPIERQYLCINNTGSAVDRYTPLQPDDSGDGWDATYGAIELVAADEASAELVWVALGPAEDGELFQAAPLTRVIEADVDTVGDPRDDYGTDTDGTFTRGNDGFGLVAVLDATAKRVLLQKKTNHSVCYSETCECDKWFGRYAYRVWRGSVPGSRTLVSSGHGALTSPYTAFALPTYNCCTEGSYVPGSQLAVTGDTEDSGDDINIQLVLYDMETYTEWSASETVALNTLRVPSSPTDDTIVFRATVPGTTGASEPTWDYDAGDTTTDGTVTWTAEYRQLDNTTCDYAKVCAEVRAWLLSGSASGIGGSQPQVMTGGNSDCRVVYDTTGAQASITTDTVFDVLWFNAETPPANAQTALVFSDTSDPMDDTGGLVNFNGDEETGTVTYQIPPPGSRKAAGTAGGADDIDIGSDGRARAIILEVYEISTSLSPGEGTFSYEFFLFGHCLENAI